MTSVDYYEEAYREEEELRCPQCGETRLIVDHVRGDIICPVCGYVVSERTIDQGPEWRAFDSDEQDKRSRVGAPINPLMPEMLSTDIDWSSKDAAGREIDASRRAEIQRLRKWQTRTRMQSSLERNLAQASMEVERLGAQLGLPKKVLERALEIYRKALETGLVRGRSIESVVAATIYAACREMKIPRTLDEIAKFTRAGRKDVARCYRLLIRKTAVSVPLADPINFVPRIGEQLKLSTRTIIRAIEILKEAKKLGITAGKDPAGLAAAAIYIASLQMGEVRTQKEVAQAAQVTEVTVRNRYKELARKLGIKLPIR